MAHTGRARRRPERIGRRAHRHGVHPRDIGRVRIYLQPLERGRQGGSGNGSLLGAGGEIPDPLLTLRVELIGPETALDEDA